jgi:hypothetical protein
VLLQTGRLQGLRDLSNNDRISHIRDIFSICTNILLDHAIEGVVFGGVPHSCADYILLEAAKNLGLQCILFMDQPFFPGSSFCYNSSLELIQGYTIGRYIPQYSYHYRWLRDICAEVADKYDRTGSLEMFKPDHDPDDTGWSSLYNRDKNGRHNISDNGKTYYEHWSRESRELNQDKIISLMLHCEPEATINPSIDQCFMNQLELAIYIRERTSLDIPLGIKEHPGMFTCYPEEDKRYLHEHRSDYFLKRLKSLPNTFLISPDASMHDVIVNSSLVVSSSGTSGIEALLAKKTVVGNRLSCLNGVPGFYNALTYEHKWDFGSHKALANLTTREIVSYMCMNSVPGSPAGNYNLLYRPDPEKNEYNMACSIGGALAKLDGGG